MRKRFKDLNLNSSFLFAALFSDPEACKMLLEILLDRKISKVNVKTENSILLSSDARCIRLDVNARDEFNVNYDIDAQNTDEGNIVKRARYYQAEMDVAELKPGDDFNRLPDSYVIFICTFDPFGEGLYRYTFIERCEENGMALQDGTCKIFINTKGTNIKEVPEVLIHFLEYYENSTDEYVSSIDDKAISNIHHKVTQLKSSREWEAGYMKMEELLEKKKREGHLEGIKEGQHYALVKLILTFLSDKGDVSDVLKDRIDRENDTDKLNQWIKLAVMADSIQSFEMKM